MSRRYTFNYGNHMPMLGKPHEYEADRVVHADCPPMPVNIERLLPINRDPHDQDPHDQIDRNTKETNAIWRHALRRRGSVWQYYQLVMTQWPVNTGTSKYDPVNCNVDGEMVLCGTPETTIPGTIPGSRFDHSAFTNTTLETWKQTDVEHGCMNCHSINAMDHIDFVWSLRVNAYRKPDRLRSSPALLELQKLLGTEVKQFPDRWRSRLELHPSIRRLIGSICSGLLLRYPERGDRANRGQLIQGFGRRRAAPRGLSPIRACAAGPATT
jgi:hypothetical protein